MSSWSRDGKTPNRDVMQQRIAAGTLGGDLIMPKGVGGKKALAVVDNLDPAITYGVHGASSASFSNYANTPWLQQGTQTVLATDGASASYTFRGTSIAVIGSMNPYSGNMVIYIDGVLTPGRVPTFCGIDLNPSVANDPGLTAAATTLSSFGSTTGFPSTGTLYINGELLSYSSKDGFGFYGLTRGLNGTTAADHWSNETVYLWDSGVGLYTTGNATKQIIYYNPLLAPGDHTIEIVAQTNVTSGYPRVHFDAFLTGSLLGAGNIFTQLATATLTATPSSNGHMDIGQFTLINADVSIISILGYSQTNCEADNTNAMGTLGVRFQEDGTPYYYLHNGPTGGTPITIVITFAFIGESI